VPAGKVVKKFHNFEHKGGVWHVKFVPASRFPFTTKKRLALPTQIPVSVSGDRTVFWDPDKATPICYEWKVVLNAIQDRQFARKPGVPLDAKAPYAGAGDVALAGFGCDAVELSTGGRLADNGGAIKALAISADARRAVTVGGDGRVRVWDLKARQLLPGMPWKPDDAVSAAALTPDGSHVLLGGPDGGLRLWKLP
jgi:WD40 repeat protein